MAYILNIETSTPVCSVALSDKDRILALRESSEEKSHAGNLAVFIEEILKEQHMTVHDLNAIAVGKGPGSYTGLRIGVATAKGLAYGAKIPLIAISTLETMVVFALHRIKEEKQAVILNKETLLCPMIDARRMEVYMALFDHSGKRKQSDAAVIVDADTFNTIPSSQHIIFFGSGATKCREVLNRQNASWIDDIYPSAKAMASEAYRLFEAKNYEDIAYFEPYYLKDFVTTTTRKKLIYRLTKSR